MRRLREILDQAQAAGLTVEVGPECPHWLASLAKPDSCHGAGAPRLHLVETNTLDRATLSAGDQALVVLEDGSAQLAPTLVAQTLATHSLQIVEILPIPPPDHVEKEPSQPECLVLARVVQQPLGLTAMDPWAADPPPLTPGAQLAATNLAVMQPWAHLYRVCELVVRREADADAAAQLTAQLHQESADQAKALGNQVRSLQRQLNAWQNLSTLRFIKRKTGAVLRRLPGGTSLINLARRFLARVRR